MQKVKKNSLSSFFITSFSLVLAIVLSFSLVLFKPRSANASDTLKNGVGFISATTSIRQTEPELINNKLVSSYTLENNETYYLEKDAIGEYIKYERESEVFDYIHINKDNYCDEDGNPSISNSGYASPTNWIDLSQVFSSNQATNPQTFYKILNIADCKTIIIDNNEYLFDGINFYNFSEKKYNSSANEYSISDTQTPYALITFNIPEKKHIINISKQPGNRYNKVIVEGYNYKKFNNYTLLEESPIPNGIDLYFKSPTSSDYLLLNAEQSINKSNYTLLDENLDQLPFKDIDGNQTTTLADDKNINNATYIKINDELYVPIENNIYSKNISAENPYYYNTFYENENIQNQTANPIYSLRYDSNSSNFLNTYKYDANNERIPLRDITYKNANNEIVNLFNNVYYDNVGGEITSTQTPSIALNNHLKKNSLLSGSSVVENIENYYIAFGDIDHVSNLNSNIIINDLQVSAKLTNKYYNNRSVLLNNVITTSNNNDQKVNNHYWYQYFDLENIYLITETGDVTKTEKALYPEGLYTFNFSYSVFENNSSSTYDFTYSIYLYNTSSYSDYPSFNTDILMEGEVVGGENLSYYYNYQTNEYPTYSFDPSKFSVEYSKYANGQTHNYFTSFRTDSRTSNFYTNDETPVANEVSYIYINEQLSNTSSIIETYRVNAYLFESSNSNKLTYIYVYWKQLNTTSFAFSHKETVEIEKSKDKEEYTISKYITYDANLLEASANSDKGDIVSLEKITYNYTVDTVDGEFKTTIENITQKLDLNTDINNITSDNIISSTSLKTTSETKFNNNKYLNSTSTIKTTINNVDITENNSDLPAINFNYLFNCESDKKIFTYNYDLIFKDLGQYTITNKNIISTANPKDVYLELTNSALNFNPEFKNRNLSNVHEDGYNLTIFGVRSYFNKNGATEFLNENVNSNVSELINSSDDINLNSLTPPQISNHESIYSNLFETNADGTEETKVSIPNTNMPPITFDFLCEYMHDSNRPVSKMYIFNSTQFSYNFTTEKATLKKDATPTPYNFDKNTYPSSDGLYIIVIDYTYSNFTFSNKIGEVYNNNRFERGHQVFAFVIDNSSPEIKIEKQVSKVESETEISKSWKYLERGSYTNTNVRITYSTPSFFQYDKTIALQKTNYDGITSNYGSGSSSWQEYQISSPKRTNAISIETIDHSNKTKFAKLMENNNSVFSTIYSNNLSVVPVFSILPLNGSGENFILNNKDTFIPSDFDNLSSADKENLYSNHVTYVNGEPIINVHVHNYYYEFMVYASNKGSIWGSGHYNIKLNYGAKQNSNITYKFTIDTLPISNMRIFGVTDDFILDTNLDLSSNLINNSFTFLYDAKTSGAPIKTTYKKYTFSYSKNYGSLLLTGKNISGISVDNFLNINSANDSLVYDYIYDFSYSENKTGSNSSANTVYKSNVFNPTITTFYVFELIDSAGNTNIFYVIFDNSIPKYNVTALNEDENSNSITNVDGISILTDSTEIFWGNNKAIELEYFNNKNISNLLDYNNSLLTLNNYIFNKTVNYNAKSIDKFFNALLNSTSGYKNAQIKPFYKSLDNKLIEVTDEFIEFNNSTFSYPNVETVGNTVTYKIDQEIEVEIANQNIDGRHVPTLYYYLLVPIQKANFNFQNTNSDNTNSDTKNYYANEQASVLLDVNQLTLAKNYSQKHGLNLESVKSVINSSSYTDPSNSNFYKYGFYGEKKYNFTISDVLFNEDQYALWMNFDLSRAWAYGTFNLEQTALSKFNNHTLQLLPNESTYATGQLYFSYMPKGSGEGIPDSQIDYKFYEFDMDFYDQYFLSNIEVIDYDQNSAPNGEIVLDNSQSYKLTFKDVNDPDNPSASISKIIEKNKYLGTYANATEDSDDYGKIIRTEPNSFYPFNLISKTTGNNGSPWVTLFSSSVNSASTYVKADDPKRVFSTLLQPDESSSSFLNSKAGLYVFKRTYTDYIDANGNIITNYTDDLASLGNDTPIRYYVYYVDRNSIIDITNKIGLNIEFLLGVGNSDENYITTKSANYIETIQNASSSATSNATNSSKSVSNLFSTNRNLVESIYAIDKYAAVKKFNELVTIGSDNVKYKDSTFSDLNSKLIMQKYVFNLSTNQFFLNFTLTDNNSNPTIFIGNSGGDKNYIDPHAKLKNENFALTSLSNGVANSLSSETKPLNNTNYAPEQLADRLLTLNQTRILLRKAYTYNFNIEDNAGYDNNNEGKYNHNANSYFMSYTISTSKPEGSYWGKFDSFNYGSNIDGESSYANSLLKDFETLKNLSTQYTMDDNNNISFGYSNNNALIFGYELSKNLTDTEAEIAPFEITITKTNDKNVTTQLLQIKTSYENNQFVPEYYSNQGLLSNSDTRRLSLIYDSTKETPTQFLIVVFDNSTQIKEYNNLLSNAEDNATYSISVQYKGDESLYLSDPRSNASYFKTYDKITIDHIKPLRNVIKLMEKDSFISRKNLSFSFGYSPATGVDTYIQNSSLSGLSLQANLESIYNEYMKAYNKVQHNYFFALDLSNPEALSFNYNRISDIQQLDHKTNRGMFFRLIDDPVNYKYSITPDDSSSNSSNPDHPVFQESLAENTTLNNVVANTYYVLDNLNLLSAGNYYEIIESDEAGNYRVYAVYGAYSSSYKLKYNKINSDNTISGGNYEIGHYSRAAVASTYIQTKAQTIYGMGLNISYSKNSFINSKNELINFTTDNLTPDTYQKYELSYSFTNEYNNDGNKSYTTFNNFSNPIVIETNPIDNNISINMNGSNVINQFRVNSLNKTLTNGINTFEFKNSSLLEKTNEILNYLQAIYNQIIENNADSALDFHFNIKIYDRVSGEYTISYYYPGKLLDLVFSETSNGLKVQIPEDSSSVITQIVRFEVRKFINNTWDPSIMDYGDNIGNTFIQFNNNKSLGGSTYYLPGGVYRFTLIDNFGRTNEIIRTYQQNTVTNNIEYTGKVIEKTVEGSKENYTAKPVVLTYDLSFYKIAISYKSSTSSEFFSYDIELLTNEDQTVADLFLIKADQISATGKKITISPLDNNHVTLKVVLKSVADTSYTETHIFNLYTKIPKFEIENMNGKSIMVSNNQLFIEDFNIILNNLNLEYIDFSTVIRIEYINPSGESVISTTNTLFEVKQAGTYKVKTTNALGYSSAEYIIIRASETTVSYSVYAVDNSGNATQLKYSDRFTTTHPTLQKHLVYHYYALNKYAGGYSIDDGGKIKESLTGDHILIITNSNNSVVYEIETYDQTQKFVLIKIFTKSEDSSNEHILHYIQINFIDESSNFANFVVTNNNNDVISKTSIVENKININLTNSFNTIKGNLIEISYSFNGQYVDTISSYLSTLSNIDGFNNPIYNYLTLTESGIYRFTISDYAGNKLKNTQTGNNYFEIILLNSVIYTINENVQGEPIAPIDNYITNKPVNLKLVTKINNVELYTITSVTVYKNGNEIEVQEAGENKYTFTDAGNYFINVVATLKDGEVISSNIHFTIINANIAMLSLSISTAKGFEIVEIQRKSVTAENSRFSKLELSNKNELWLSSLNSETGNGYYFITLRWFHKGLQQYLEFSFDVRINDEIPTIYANIEFGTSSKNPIIIYYNPGKIYNQVGESQLTINDVVIAIIDSNSENTQKSFILTESDNYYIKVVDPDGRTLTTYKVTKTTPLNSTAKILIAVGVILVVGLTVLFIIMRRKVRFK